MLCLLCLHKHDIDPNSNINYSRKIGPVVELPDSSQCLADIAQKSCGDGVVHNVWMKPANLTYFDKIKYSNSSLILNV